jgi:hypothetical protein
MENVCLSGLYYRYKNTKDDLILDLLKKVKIVKKSTIGNSNSFAYYPLTKKSLNKILKNPRGVSLTFDAADTITKPIRGLVEYKTIVYLVKSTSRFFLKPDIGEVLDQINWEDLYSLKFNAICINEGYETLDETEGEHFIMTATLLKKVEKNVDKDINDAIKKLHQL